MTIEQMRDVQRRINDMHQRFRDIEWSGGLPVTVMAGRTAPLAVSMPEAWPAP
jgi:hypothetical protein